MGTLTIRLPRDLDERLRAYAEREERTRTWIISKALERFLEEPKKKELEALKAAGLIRNVKDFGAKGDGSTNDRPAIQAAVDSFPPGRRCSCGGTENIMGCCSKCNQKDRWEE